MYKKVFSIISAVAISLCCTSCSNVGNKKDRTIVDCAGYEVAIDNDIDRVVCVSQNAMEFMVAMGQRDKLIGVHKSVKAHTWSPEFISDIDSLKGFGYTPALEALYEAEADLVIVKTAQAAEELRNAGIPAVTFSYTNNEEMIYAVNMLGDIFGKEAESFADAWIEDYKNTTEEIKSKTASLSEEEKPSVYFIDASVALDAGGLCTTVGGDSIVSEWFTNCGADFVTKEYTNISEINEEAILKINPDVIFIGGWSENTRKEQLLSDVKWQDVNAVKNNKVYLCPDGYISFERYAVESPLLLRYTVSLLYPNLYPYDITTDFRNHFYKYYGAELTEETINNMLNGFSPDGSRMD